MLAQQITKLIERLMWIAVIKPSHRCITKYDKVHQHANKAYSIYTDTEHIELNEMALRT